MSTRRPRGRRIAEQQGNYILESARPPFASTPGQIQRAVERNSIQRGVFILNQLHAQNFDALVKRVEMLVESYDEVEWRQHGTAWGINLKALDALDALHPPAQYPHYFCTPEILLADPYLIKYYRNVAMVSQKVMGDMQLSTTAYEAGMLPSLEIAQSLAYHFNTISSALVLQGLVTSQRHLEMAYANLGDSLGGAWRNEVGRLAYVEILTPLLRHLHTLNCLDYIQYSLKGAVVQDDAENQRPARGPYKTEITVQTDLVSLLSSLELQRVVYTEIGLRNGNKLMINRQLTWANPTGGEGFKIGPDLLSTSADNPILWGGELKGGADPAGSDEHWKTATQAFSRIILACKETGQPQPPLSFIATILVDRVAREAEAWIAQGKLTSVYNLTQIADDPMKQTAFLMDLTTFLGCAIKPEPAA